MLLFNDVYVPPNGDVSISCNFYRHLCSHP